MKSEKFVKVYVSEMVVSNCRVYSSEIIVPNNRGRLLGDGIIQ